MDSNMLVEKFLSMLRMGDTHAHRHFSVITIGENKVRELMMSDPYFADLAEREQDDLQKLFEQAQRSHQKDQQDYERAKREQSAEAAKRRAEEKLQARLKREQLVLSKKNHKKYAARISDSMATARGAFDHAEKKKAKK